MTDVGNRSINGVEVIEVAKPGPELYQVLTADGVWHDVSMMTYEVMRNALDAVVQSAAHAPLQVPATQWPQDRPRTMQQVEELTTFKIYANDLRAVLSEWLAENVGAVIDGTHDIDALMYKIALRSKVR